MPLPLTGSPLPLLPSRAPSLQAFDELLLLKRGGRTIFHGPIGRRAADLVSYFEAVPGMKGVGNLKWRYSSRCQGAGGTARAWAHVCAHRRSAELIGVGMTLASSPPAGVRPCPDGFNPATWMLEVTALGPEQKLGIDFADIYAESDLCRCVRLGGG